MQYFFTRMFLTLILFVSFVIPVQAAEQYNLDPMHTYVLWHINHFGYSIQAGKFTDVEGTITMDNASPAKSKVAVTIPMDKIATGLPKLDEHLLDGDFFNVAKYPTAKFVSNKIVLTGKNTAKIYGTLTLLDKAKPVVLDVKMLKTGMHPITNKKTMGFLATTKFKRSEFGIDKYIPGLGDDVEIEIGAEASLAPNDAS